MTAAAAIPEKYSASPREHDRIAHLVLGQRIPEPPAPKKPAGMSRQEWKAHKPIVVAQMKAEAARSSDIMRAAEMNEYWRGTAGTPQTLERAARMQQGSLARLHRSGDITANLLAASEQICAVVESIQAEVALPIASWETRVDSGFRPDAALLQSVGAVRWEAAYTRWRAQVVGPTSMLLEMIVDDVPYTVAAGRYRVGPKRAKRLLVDALELWCRVRGIVGRELTVERIAEERAAIFA